MVHLALESVTPSPTRSACGKSSFHIQKSRCAACGYPLARKRTGNEDHSAESDTSLPNEPSDSGGSNKALRRNTTGTGRMAHLRDVQRRFKNGFREGTQVLHSIWFVVAPRYNRFFLSLGPQAEQVDFSSKLS